MNSNTLTLASASAAIAAIALLPFSSVAAGVVFVAAGLLSVFVADYGREIKPLRAEARVIRFRLGEGNCLAKAA